MFCTEEAQPQCEALGKTATPRGRSIGRGRSAGNARAHRPFWPQTMKKEKGKLDNLLLRQNGQEEATSNGTAQTQGDQAEAASVEGGVHTPSKL